MPYKLRLSVNLRKGGWKVVIHDFERLEPPHITIYRKSEKWRLSLRTGGFLVPGGKWSEIDDNVRKAIVAAWKDLIAEWDKIHPDNPVVHKEGENDKDAEK